MRRRVVDWILGNEKDFADAFFIEKQFKNF